MVLGIPHTNNQYCIDKGFKPTPMSCSKNNFFRDDSNTVLKWEEIQELLERPRVLSSSIEIHIIRHAESEINAQKRITGSQDVKLTPRGREQAKHLGQKLDESYDVAFTSTLERAYETLNLALGNGNVNVGTIIRDSRLNERSLGILEGKRQHTVLEYAAGDLDYAPEQGESYREVTQRIISFLLNLFESVSEQKLEKVLICSHMGPMRIMVGILADIANPVEVLNFRFSNAEVLKINWEKLQLPKFLN